MKKIVKCFLILIMISVCIGCSGTSSDEGTTYKECYYGDNEEEFCVDKYIPADPDIDPYYW